jgi:hypothetical protein
MLRLIVGLLLGGLFLCGICVAQEMEMRHGHPPQDMEIHQKFYKTWMMPSNRSISCCNAEDCSPAESKFENGHWLARKVGDTGNFTPIPAAKIERDRDTPDGRSHVCGRRYGEDFVVFCFIPGAGG